MDIKGLKDKILQLAIQGKLVQQDENDEPASVLLERINEEKERLIKEKKIKRQKPLPEITETEKPFEIPKGWEWVRLGEIADNIHYGYTAPAENIDTGVKMLRITDIQNGNVNWENVPYCKIEDSKILNYKLKHGDILIARTGGTIGKNFLITEIILTSVFASYLIRIDLNLKMNYQYISYFLNSNLYWQQLHEKSQGTGQPNVNATSLSELILPLPPLAEQKRIVEKIDYLFALIDELDSNKEDLLEVINLTRNQVLQEAIQGKLVAQSENDEPVSVLLEKIEKEKEKLIKGKKIRREKPLPEITEEEKPFEIPDSWKWMRLGDIGEIVGGGTPQTAIKEYWEGGTIAWLTPADLSNYKDKYISRGRRDITPLGLKESSAQLMPKGTVLFSSRAPIGYTVIAQNEISTNQGFKSCIPFIMDMNEYLYYYLIYSARVINENASGTTFKEVSGTEVKNLIFPLPSLEEQKRIVKKVDTIMAMLDKLASELII